MANILDYTAVFSKALDLQLSQKATSGWMQDNAKQVKYIGGRSIKIPKISMTGLGDYDREEGKYPKSVILTEYQSFELSMDRGAQFYFDRNDVDETGYTTEAGAIMGRFQKEHVIPEIDAYRYAKIYEYAVNGGKTRTYNCTKSDILSNLLKDLRKVQDLTGIDFKDMVISMPYTIFETLELSGELNRSIIPAEFSQGGVSTEINSINGAPLIPVPSIRMKTAYEFSSSAGTGLTPESGAKSINWIISAKDTPIAIAKTDSLKIFSPDQNQEGDGWKTQYRVYHDIILPESKIDTVFVNVGN